MQNLVIQTNKNVQLELNIGSKHHFKLFSYLSRGLGVKKGENRGVKYHFLSFFWWKKFLWTVNYAILGKNDSVGLARDCRIYFMPIRYILGGFRGQIGGKTGDKIAIFSLFSIRKAIQISYSAENGKQLFFGTCQRL